MSLSRLCPSPSQEGINQELLEAALFGNVDRASRLLHLGAQLKTRDDDGWTAVHCAASNGHDAVLHLLTKSNASLHSKDRDGNSPLHLAVIHDHPSTILTLHQLGCEINAINNKKQTALFCARSRNSAMALLQRGASMEHRDANDLTPLMWFAQETSPFAMAIVKLLVARGANKNAIDKHHGRSALHWAAAAGNTRCMELLLAAGANGTLADKQGNTAATLLASTQRAQEQSLRFLHITERKPVTRSPTPATPATRQYIETEYLPLSMSQQMAPTRPTSPSPPVRTSTQSPLHPATSIKSSPGPRARARARSVLASRTRHNDDVKRSHSRTGVRDDEYCSVTAGRAPLLLRSWNAAPRTRFTPQSPQRYLSQQIEEQVMRYRVNKLTMRCHEIEADVQQSQMMQGAAVVKSTLQLR